VPKCGMESDGIRCGRSAGIGISISPYQHPTFVLPNQNKTPSIFVSDFTFKIFQMPLKESDT